MAATTVLDPKKNNFFFHCAENPDNFPAKKRIVGQEWGAKGLLHVILLQVSFSLALG